MRVDWSTVIKLVIASVIVGAIFAILGADPLDFWAGLWAALRETAETLVESGFDGILAVLRYAVLGAVVVVPIWLISVATKRRPRRRDDRS